MDAQSQIGLHWRKFARVTTFHGIHEISESSSIFGKTIWALIIAASTTALAYQTTEMVKSYLGESTVTQVTTLSGSYPSPRIMLGIPPHLLVRSERQDKQSRLPELDPEAFLYARSIIEAQTYVTKTVKAFNASRAKEKFAEYLAKFNVTWAEAIAPYILDASPWLGESH